MDLRVFLKLDGSGFTQGLTSARQAVGRFGSQAFGGLKSQIAGAFTVGAVTALSKRTIDAAGRVQDLSDRLGVSTDFLQEFRYVAKQTGTDLEALTAIVERMNSARDAALSGGKAGEKMTQAFGAFGISQSDLKTQRLEDLLSNQIATAFQKGDPQGKLAAAFREIGGRGSGQLIAGFTEGFNEMRDKARTAGKIWSEEQIQALDEMGDALTVFGDRLLVEWGGILINMYEMLQKLGSKFEGSLNYMVGGTSQWGGKDWAANALNLITGKRIGASGAKPFDYGLATQTAKGFFGDFKKETQDILDARAQARRLRADRRAGADVTPIAIDEEKTKKAREPKSDSLISVGNFLGAGRGAIESIYREQLTEAKKTNAKLDRIYYVLDRKGNGGSIEVPN